MLPVNFSNSALSDIQEAYDFLEARRTGFGEKLLSQIEHYISIIELNPYLFKEDYKKVRQIKVRPFRYLLRYKIYDTHTTVIQLFQGNRNPDKKLIN